MAHDVTCEVVSALGRGAVHISAEDSRFADISRPTVLVASAGQAAVAEEEVVTGIANHVGRAAKEVERNAHVCAVPPGPGSAEKTF